MAGERQRAANISEFVAAEQTRNIWSHEAAEDIEVEHLTDPAYWRNLGHMLREWDRIEVRHCAGRWFAELMVRSAGRLYANVVVLRKTQFADAKVPDDIASSDYDVRFLRGKGHMVVRKADKAIIKDGFKTVAEAAHWITDNLAIRAA